MSVFNFSEIMAEKKATERAAAQQEAKAPDKGGFSLRRPRRLGRSKKSPKQDQAPKRRGRPPKADKEKTASPGTERGSQQEG